MVKVTLRLAVVDFFLVVLYMLVSNLEWNSLMGLPLVTVIDWALLRTQIWFGGTVPVIVDGTLLIYNWSFIILLAIIAINLATVWKIENKNIED